MNTAQDLNPGTAPRVRARRLAWLAAGAAVLGTLVVLGPAPAGDALPGAATTTETSRVEPLASPFALEGTAALTGQVDWDAKEAAPDPSPMSVAAYER
jgi:hypothetical protein